MKKDGTLTRVSVAELKRRRGESRTDLARVRAMTEAELERAIASDPDWKDVPRDWHLKAEAIMPKAKKLVSLRLDSDVFDWFRGQGAGYQTRMNAVLRSFMEHERDRESSG